MKELAERIHVGRRAITLARQRGLDTAEWSRYLAGLIEAAGREPGQDQGLVPWMLWEWRRVSIPQWKHILSESISKNDKHREEYARWMLQDILLDPDYEDPTS